MNPISLLVFAATLASSSAVYYLPGIQLNEDAKVTNWTAFEQNGIQFAITRGTKGASYVDPTFLINWEHLEKMNITYGAYHWYDSSNTAHENFANVNKNIFGTVNMTSKPLFAVWINDNPGGLSQDVLADNYHTFLWLVERKLGTKPIILTSKSDWATLLGSTCDDYDFGSYRLWIYELDEVFQPEISSTWKDFYVWTFSDKRQVKGMDKTGARILWMKQ